MLHYKMNNYVDLRKKLYFLCTYEFDENYFIYNLRYIIILFLLFYFKPAN